MKHQHNYTLDEIYNTYRNAGFIVTPVGAIGMLISLGRRMSMMEVSLVLDIEYDDMRYYGNGILVLC